MLIFAGLLCIASSTMITEPTDFIDNKPKNVYGDSNKVMPLNIIWIWFDDLGFGDCGFNGGDFPTPILDKLASSNAIKINMHYTEPICSASRSALLTGRYAWQTGINSVAKLFTETRFNTENRLFPEILNYHGWKTGIFGKWHIGYSHDDNLPGNNGFESGIYTRSPRQYYYRGFTRKQKRLDALFGAPSDSIQELRKSLLGNVELPVHDTLSIKDKKESPIYTDSQTDAYNEDLFTLGMLKSIKEHREKEEPLFLYYSLFTPHAAVVQPPDTRYNDKQTAVDYDHCYQGLGLSEQECTVEDNARCVFCKQVHYASLHIEDILDELKGCQHGLDWDQTLVVITSDNGAAPTSKSGAAFGSAMPYRGIKGSTYEGGLRTPALLKGGFIEKILKENSKLTDNVCEYNGMVHISDWYHMFMDIVGLPDQDERYKVDQDHKDLEIWDNIQCSCQAETEDEEKHCDVKFPPRKQLISMRMCGEVETEWSEGSKFFFSTTLIKDGIKLLINASHAVSSQCDSIGSVKATTESCYITEYDEQYMTPNQIYYEDWLMPHKNGAANNMGDIYYKSECLDDLYKECMNSDDHNKADINNDNYQRFGYDEMMMFDIKNDKLEACDIQNDQDKKSELFSYLKERSKEYGVSTSTPSYSFCAFVKMMQSFDCNTFYTMPWNEMDCSSMTMDDVWKDFLYEVTWNCPDGSFLSKTSKQLQRIWCQNEYHEDC